ncbi:hypothetical protein M758_1G147500 [Ceratodon purpureus]|nr:hypothetical protein M758_1G147500 [Ceratodon purpureus]
MCSPWADGVETPLGETAGTHSSRHLGMIPQQNQAHLHIVVEIGMNLPLIVLKLSPSLQTRTQAQNLLWSGENLSREPQKSVAGMQYHQRTMTPQLTPLNHRDVMGIGMNLLLIVMAVDLVIEIGVNLLLIAVVAEVVEDVKGIFCLFT